MRKDKMYHYQNMEECPYGAEDWQYNRTNADHDGRDAGETGEIRGSTALPPYFQKPSIYIDERTALLSSEEADIRWINNEMSKVREEDRSPGDKEDAVL